MAMQFLSDNAAAVHPRVWAAMQAADAADAPYDGDALSRRLDAAFAELFGRPCAALWVASGTAANCLALAALVPPHGGVVCHREAHIETDECGAPGFYTHGAKLLLAEGEGAKLTGEAITAVLAGIRGDVHQVQAHAVSITQASEYGRAYTVEEIDGIALFCAAHGLALHIDGARFANAAARELAAAAGERLLHPVEANEVFLAVSPAERAALRAQGFSFYDWGDAAARLVTAWNSDSRHVAALARTISAL